MLHKIKYSIFRICLAFSFGLLVAGCAASKSTPFSITMLSHSSGGVAGDFNSTTSGSNNSFTEMNREVVFTSYASNLVENDDNDAGDIFVADLSSGVIKLLSRRVDGALGNDDSTVPSISADGRYVAFQSLASNLVANDDNDVRDVFLLDRKTGSIKLISQNASSELGNDDSLRPEISDDGFYVVFESSANNLDVRDRNTVSDIYVFNRRSNSVTMAIDGVSLIYERSESPSVSADGRFIAFSSYADTLLYEDKNRVQDVFVLDQVTDELEMISKDLFYYDINSPDAAEHAVAANPVVSADGRIVIFGSNRNNLVSNDRNGENDIFAFDRKTQKIELISKKRDGTQGDAGSHYPSVSADGNIVTFTSASTNFSKNNDNGHTDVYVVDRRSGHLELVSKTNSGKPANSNWPRFSHPHSNRGSGNSTISADGKFVLFQSKSTLLIPPFIEVPRQRTNAFLARRQ